MKRVFLFLICLFALFSCQKESFLIIDSYDYQFPAVGGTINFHFSASEEWTASASDSWVTISPTRGMAGDNTIAITVGTNPVIGSSRWSEVQIKISDKSESICLYQDEGEGYIIEKTNFEIGKYGGTLRIPIKANISDYFCSVDKDCESWISIVNTKSLDSHHIQLEISENTHGEIREGFVSVSYNNQEDKITIKQAEGDELIVTTTSFEVGSAGGEIIVPVSTNNEILLDLLDCYNWIQARTVQTKTMKDYDIVLTVSPNYDYDERIGQIKVQSGYYEGGIFCLDGNESIITVTQGQKDELIVTETSYKIGSNGGTISIPIRSNVDYSAKVLEDNSWISIQSIATKSLETSYINVSIDENSTYDARVGQIKITGADKESIVTLTQNQRDEIIVGNTIYEIDSDGGTITIPIESNIQYEAKFTKQYDWIKLENVSTKGLESSSLVLQVNANNTYDERVAELLISSNDNKTISKQVIITQAQKDGLLVSKEEYEVSRRETTITLDVQHNIEFDVQISCDWISSVNTKALQTTSAAFLISENNTGEERIGEITLFSKDNQVIKKVTVKQLNTHPYKGDYTISSIEAIRLLKDGGYTRIDGNLTIMNIPNVSDLDNLIEEITGNLTVYNISNFDGLYGLKRVGGDLRIRFSSDCTTLLSLEGLNNLESIGGSLDCSYTWWHSSDKGILSGFAESDFEKLSNLKSIGGNLNIELFPYRPGNLSSLKGLESLSSIGGDIHTESLPSLEGLSGINEVKSLYVEKASNIDGLINLKRVHGDVTLLNGKYDSFNGLRNLEYIGGNFEIHASVNVGTYQSSVEGFSKITSLSGFDSLREIVGDFKIRSYVSVTATSGVGYGLNNLTNLNGLNSLRRIGGSMIIEAVGAEGPMNSYDHPTGYCLNNLSSINIASLEEIGGDLVLDIQHDCNGRDDTTFYLTRLSDFSFSSLKSIGGDITNHYFLYKGAGTYYEKEGYGEIKKAPSNLQSVQNINAICAFEQESDGFTSLETVENLYGNGTGFPNLKSITGSFEITGSSITEIGLMPCLEIVTNSLTIKNTDVTQIQSFNKLSSVGNITITENPKLSSIIGFANLSKCTGITISGSPSMYDFGVFVNAVENGSSWSVSGCGYNPTKYQMQNGQCKP